MLSRVVRVRVARNADSLVAVFAQRELGLKSEREVAQRVAAADGCIGQLLGSGRPGRGPEAADAFRATATQGAVQRFAFALSQAPFEARGGFTEMLDGLLERLRDQARRGGETGKVVEAIARVLDARAFAQGHANPQPLAAVLAGTGAGFRAGGGANRGRDGGADGRFGRLAHRLRHGQGGGSRDADRAGAAAREDGRRARRLAAGRWRLTRN